MLAAYFLARHHMPAVGVASRFLIHVDGVVAPAEPRKKIGQDARQLLLRRLGDDGDRLHVHLGKSLAVYRTACYSNRACSRNSRFPSAPRIGESITSTSLPPSATTAFLTRSTAPCCAPVSRTIPPLLTCSRPTSNCGFTNTTSSKLWSSFAQPTTAGKTSVAEMNDTSIAIRAIGRCSSPDGHNCSRVRYRAFVFSSSRTRGSARNFTSI